MINRIVLLFAFLSLLSFSPGIGNENTPLWMRYPKISPDGKTVAFSYKGDIYTVSVSGGTAIPLTISDAHDYMPVWSPDSKSIAFASDRNGNFDVFVIPAEGGKAKRLTYHSSGDFPSCFSSDGKEVYFTSSRMDNVDNVMFPSGVLPEFFSVNVSGGREFQRLSIPAEDAQWNKTGNKLLFHDRKGYEDAWRKHHQSSVARDIWMYDKAANAFSKLSSFAGEDRNPIWSSDEKEIYYLSEESGTFNVWKMEASNANNKKQITTFEKNPVRFLSKSDNGRLCFGYDGEIYTMNEGSAPEKIKITIVADERFNEVRTESFTGGATEMNVSSNGKEAVFVVRGEVFVTSLEGGMVKRITNTPGQERSVSFSPDGKSILYASERNNIWGLYTTSMVRPEESYFFQSTLLKEEPLLVGNKESFQPVWSPDGKEVAFIEDRTAVKIINLATKAVRAILPAEKSYSYTDGDQWFDWSPDGKYLLVQFLQDNHWQSQVGLVPADGNGKLTDLTESGFDNGSPVWSKDGKMMYWVSNRHGMKNVASHGQQSDIYGLFFSKAAFERFKLSKEEFELLKEKEKEKEKDKDKDKKEEDKSASKKTEKVEEVKIEMEGLQDRKVRLTLHSSDLAAALLSKDGEQLFYLCRFEKGYDLWSHKFREKETKLMVRLDAGSVRSLQMDKEGKNLFMVVNGNLVKVVIEKSEKKDIGFNVEMNLNLFKEREYEFEHAWRQVSNKFYVSDLQKTDWNYYKQAYAKFLPHINNNRDFAEMMSEMLGELNASHTGCRYNAKYKNPDETAALGVFYDENYSGKGLKILEVIDKGPLDLDGSKIKSGVVIEKIDGIELTENANQFELLNRKAGKYTLLSLFDPAAGNRWEITVKPISWWEQNDLLYHRWIRKMQSLTDKLSKGEVAYMHVRGMNDESYRAFYEQVMGKYSNKKALIVDTRFNGGGWMHDDLATFLSGKKYIEFVPRERKIGFEPGNKWTKPSVVLMSEGNYSDAHMFPVVYKTLGIGKLVGMPVPGTGTAVWWETLQDPTLVFGIPQVGVMTMDGKYYENNQLEPDFKVMNEYLKVIAGTDQQLEKAVELMLSEIKK